MSQPVEPPAVTDGEVERLRRRLDEEAERSGYHLNPDREFTAGLVRGLLVNEARYGYPSCPCRLASGSAAEDRDIVCPCDYRDQDLGEYGACYCALYVTGEVLEGKGKLRRVPERRPSPDGAPAAAKNAGAIGLAPGSPLSHPVWRCRVCGYLCARDGPPEVCPICKAKKDRFDRFL
jgi:ferredoxin-thioredoxin reductase catalytic chain